MALGQLMVGVGGTELTAAEEAMLRHPQVGGVILFTRNYGSPEQLTALCRRIHSIREPRLLIAVDQEGGRVQRFRDVFTNLPPLITVGKAYDRDPADGKRLAELHGWLMAAELRAVGVDLSFAPVLDLDRGVSQVIGDRSFHGDPEVVAVLAQAYVRGMKRAGMSATGKHFPGHGSVAPDSHLELPVDGRRPEDILMEDMLPFERLVRAGLAGMMTAHVIYSQVDDRPASFSRKWVQEYLRARLGFQGVVFSDDLGMEAAACVGDFGQRARASLEAGCDMVLLCNLPERNSEVLDALGEPDPVAAMRLARLHGKPAPDWGALRASRAWKDARRALGTS